MMTPENLPGLSATSIRIVVAISMIIGFLVIFQSMYTAVMERTREIGILKSLGASKLYIVNVVLRETALLADLSASSWEHWSVLLTRRIILIEKPDVAAFLEQREWVARATVHRPCLGRCGRSAVSRATRRPRRIRLRRFGV